MVHRRARIENHAKDRSASGPLNNERGASPVEGVVRDESPLGYGRFELVESLLLARRLRR